MKQLTRRAVSAIRQELLRLLLSSPAVLTSMDFRKQSPIVPVGESLLMYKYYDKTIKQNIKRKKFSTINEMRYRSCLITKLIMSETEAESEV